MKTFIFLCGSSSVGKTTLLNQFPTVYEGKEIEKVEMSFRKVRELLNNPTWEDLVRYPNVGIEQQNQGMTIYEERILERYAEVDDKIYLFERCPLDIIGYSMAFNLPLDHITSLAERVRKLFDILTTTSNVLVVYRPVDYKQTYDRQDNARPPENIRKSCDLDLRLELKLIPRSVKSLISVNQGDAEITRILAQVGK